MPRYDFTQYYMRDANYDLYPTTTPSSAETFMLRFNGSLTGDNLRLMYASTINRATGVLYLGIGKSDTGYPPEYIPEETYSVSNLVAGELRELALSTNHKSILAASGVSYMNRQGNFSIYLTGTNGLHLLSGAAVITTPGCRVWTGSEWRTAYSRIWTGSEWRESDIRVRIGGDWKSGGG